MAACFGSEINPIWGRSGAWSSGRVWWGGVGRGGCEQVCDYLFSEALVGLTAGGSASGFSAFLALSCFCFCVESLFQGIALGTGEKWS
jgi:hypothetical protein